MKSKKLAYRITIYNYWKAGVKIIKIFKVRLFPTDQQIDMLWKHINTSRFVWNYALDKELEIYKTENKYLSKYDLINMFTTMKYTETYKWLSEISSHTISNVCIDLDKAYKSFFKGNSGIPKFKKKNKCKNSYPVRAENFYFVNNTAVVEKVGKIKIKENKNIPNGKGICKFYNPRIYYENNKWILSFGIECENQTHDLNEYSVGIDLGIKELAVVAYGDKTIIYKNINKTKRVKNLKHKLKHLQKKVARKYETNNRNKLYANQWHKSKNIIKTENEIRKIYKELSNIRHNYIHQTTSEIIKLLPQKIIMENLNVSGMMKNKHLSKSISEACFYEFTKQMKYKAEFNGINFVQAERFYPSSKTCSCCGNIKSNLKLNDRIYICDKCGLKIDRDINASINLMNYSKI